MTFERKNYNCCIKPVTSNRNHAYILTGLFRCLVDEADGKIWSGEKIQFFELAYTDSINFCGTDWLLCCLIVLESQFHCLYNTDVLGWSLSSF